MIIQVTTQSPANSIRVATADLGPGILCQPNDMYEITAALAAGLEDGEEFENEEQDSDEFIQNHNRN